MTLSYFCGNCGYRKEGNTVEGPTKDRITTCECGFSIRFYILAKPTKTNEEMDQAFQQTKLTKKQQFG